MSAPSAFVTLRTGISLPTAAIKLALDLESRGLTLVLDGDEVVILGPLERVTPEDRNRFRRWKPHLQQLVRYIETEAIEQ